MLVTDIIIHDREKVALEDVFLEAESREKLRQLLREYRFIDELRRYRLPINNKLMLHGSTGCGKTTTAKAIAGKLGKPLYILNLSNFVSSKIGETSLNIKRVFDKASRESAVLFLDEFDQIGKARTNDDKEVGEMRRLVNTLLQLLDYFPEKSLLIAATNFIEMIDPALVRRFQVTIRYTMPNKSVLDSFYDKMAADVPPELAAFNRRYDISFAEAKDHAMTQIKATLIDQLERAEKSESPVLP